MVEVTQIVEKASDFYSLFALDNPIFSSFVNVFFLAIFISVYMFLVWKFDKFISKKDLFGLNLKQYNQMEENFLSILFSVFLYFAEYILILPFIIFSVFIIFTFFLIILSETIEISQIFLISATIISTVRILSYYKQNPAEEVAKVLPVILLGVALLEKNFFAEVFLNRITNAFAVLPQHFTLIFHYLLFIVILETVLRFFDTLFLVLREKDKEGGKFPPPKTSKKSF